MGCCKSAEVKEPGARLAASSAAKPVPSSVLEKKVAQAKTTRVLALRECGLKQLPSSAVGSEFASLRTADLTSNALKALPEAIGTWTGLQNLTCGQNKLGELPSTIGALASLQKLVLSENQLRCLPVEISQLGKLKVLQLDLNCLGNSSSSSSAAFPEGIFAGAVSTSLEELELSSNSLEVVPASVAQLSSLQRLLVAKNRLTSLPSELARLTKLQYLDASENRIPSLPDGLLVGMTSLSELWLKGNPMDRLKLQEMKGFEAFLTRRRERLDAKIEANVVGRVDLAVCGLD